MTELDIFDTEELAWKAQRLEKEARLLRLTVKVQKAMKRLEKLELK